MKAYCFAELNNMPVIVKNYRQIKIGPWLRGEKSKRKYSNFFVFENRLVIELLKRFRGGRRIGLNNLKEPELKQIAGGTQNNYIFSDIPSWDNFFEGLKQNRVLAIRLFWQIISPGVLAEIDGKRNPCIGVHIRLGDFRKLGAGEDFRKTGSTRTPEMYFIETIEKIRAVHGTVLPVSIFSDGFINEFPNLMMLENVQLIEGNSDMADLLLLSKSKIIVTSAGSTFGYWAAFLANAPVIMHPDHIHSSIRPAEINAQWYEGPFDARSGLLLKNIQSIVC